MWPLIPALLLLAIPYAQVSALSPSSACTPATFEALVQKNVPGTSITDILASKLSNQDIQIEAPVNTNVENVCQVKVQYVYPGTNSSTVEVIMWLPEQWNERFLGTGGGGWQCSMGQKMVMRPTSEGFATGRTDGGLRGEPFRPEYTMITPGNPDKHKLERLGHRAIHEMTVLGKEVIRMYYGRAAKTSVYHGCSTGGRQGMMEASRYPDDYDGIVAGAPAFRFSELVLSLLAGQAVMAQHKYLPSTCEFQAIAEAAVEACDGVDGLQDGIVARADLCKFHASAAIGRGYMDECDSQGQVAQVSAPAAQIMQEIIEGVYASNGEKISPGFPWGSTVWSPMSQASTKVDETTGQRTFSPFPFSRDWSNDYLLEGLQTVDYSTLSADKLQSLARRSKAEYEYMMEPASDLTRFYQRGGKIISYHGYHDEILPVYNTIQKYAEIQHTMFPRHSHAASTAEMHSFYRLFLLPDVQHCNPHPGHKGIAVTTIYNDIVRWVEDGIAPERLSGDKALPATPYSEACLYPSKPFWKDGVMQCQAGITSWDAIPSIPELITRFFERLPGMLLLDPNAK